MARFNVEEFLNGCPEWLRPDARVLVMLGLTPEELREEVRKLILAHNAPAKGAATQQTVDSEFIKGVKLARLNYDQAERAAKLNGDKAPTKPKVWAQDGLAVSLMSGWITSQLGFNGTVENAEKLLAVLPGYIAAIKAKPEYAELEKFLAVVKPAKK